MLVDVGRLLLRVDDDVGLVPVPLDVLAAVPGSLQEGSVQSLETGGSVQERLLPFAAMLYGRVAARDASLQVTESFVAFCQQ